MAKAKPRKGEPREPHPYEPDDPESDEHRVRLRAHPKARASIARAKGWGGLGGFMVALLLSLHAGAPPFIAGLRALGAGVVTFVAAWAVAVAVWRQLAIAEVERARRALSERLEGEVS